MPDSVGLRFKFLKSGEGRRLTPRLFSAFKLVYFLLSELLYQEAEGVMRSALLEPTEFVSYTNDLGVLGLVVSQSFYSHVFYDMLYHF